MRTTTVFAVLFFTLVFTEDAAGWFSRVRDSDRSKTGWFSRVRDSDRSKTGWFSRVGDSDRSKTGWFSRVRDSVRSKTDFAKQAYQGAGEMYKAYRDMRKANWKNSDKYFHARGNSDAANRGPGGRWIAKVISDAREGYQSRLGGQSRKDEALDQEANRWGRNGGNPNRYRLKGLPDNY